MKVLHTMESHLAAKCLISCWMAFRDKEPLHSSKKSSSMKNTFQRNFKRNILLEISVIPENSQSQKKIPEDYFS